MNNLFVCRLGWKSFSDFVAKKT